MTDYLRLVDAVEDVFKHFSTEFNPPKASFTVGDGVDGRDFHFRNILPAFLPDGHFGVKVIDINETAGYSRGHTIVYRPDGSTLGMLPSEELTSLRCAIVSYVTARRFFGFVPETVGIVGTGRIALACAKAFWELNASHIRIKGSPRNPRKNADKFNQNTLGNYSIAMEPGDLNCCDMIITASTALSSDELIEHTQLSAPNLFISLDGGFQLGQSYRKWCKSFSDYPLQFKDHLFEEFPYDSYPPDPRSIKSILDESFNVKHGQAVTYNYGIGMADIAIAKEILACN